MIRINNCPLVLLLFSGLILSLSSCERDVEELDPAGNPVNPAVFIDGFSAGLNYAAFGGSDVTAFDVDTEVTYKGTSSMKIAVPDAGDPAGAYAGGVYFTSAPRDLSPFNVLTFWARASKAANLDLVGLGNDLAENTHIASLTNVPLTTNWQKYYIPIPDPSKLTSERGLFFYSEGPEEDRGYTLWFDEVQYEQLSTIAHGTATINDGEDITVQAETGDVFAVQGQAVFNLPTGVNQSVSASAAYFTFESSNPTVASVNDQGSITVLDAGTAVITAMLGDDIAAEGSLTIVSSGEPVRPLTTAPQPQELPEDVISIYSNAYDDIMVDFYNGFWEFSTTQSEEIQVLGDDILRYTMLNFVGIQFTTPTIDVSEATHFHMDLWTPNNTALPNEFKVLLVDLGPDGTFEGNDNTSHELTFTSPTLQSEEWVSLDIPLSDFAGLTTRSNLAQIVLSGDLPNVFVDNVYFYTGEGGSGGQNSPEMAAPDPTRDASTVLSIFSDSYTNVAVDLSPDWGQSNVVTFEEINGNNTMRYSGLDFQGVVLGESQDVSELDFLHIDYWTANSSLLNAFLISPGPAETAYPLPVPTMGWNSVDIPLSAFAGVDLTDVFQMKFDGNGTIWLDNIYFYSDDGSGGGATDPETAATEPTFDPANVISLFSESYTDVTVDTWRTDWSNAVLEDVQIDGNNVKKYSALDVVGIETVAEQVDASAMTHFHLDVWSSDFTLLGIKLVDFGADGAFQGGDDVEHQIDFAEPMQGEWINLDIPLADFTGLTTRSNIAQIILVGQPTAATTVYVDNVLFHN